MKCALLSNVNVQSIARQMQRHEVYIAPGHGLWTQELADHASGTFSFGPSSIFLLVDGAELLYEDRPDASTIAEADHQLDWIVRAAERSPEIKFFVSTVDIPVRTLRPVKGENLERRLERHWLEGITRASANYPNIYIFDLKEIVAQVGRSTLYSSKRWYLGGLRFSVGGEKLIARALERILDAQLVARKKCLLVDLDNTLWGGVIGEDGLGGIQLAKTGEGARYRDFQLRIRDLAKMGVVLGIVSKNNEADALEVFDKHEDMALRMNDFAAWKINWSPKAKNIVELAQDLNIGADSIVFIDDNPVEREAIRTALPEVTVPEFPADTSELSSFIEQLYQDWFFTLESTVEDRKRNEAYVANRKRTAERSAALSIDDFLTGLQTKILLTSVCDKDLPRAAQLTQKTNQFNLTTRRYTEQELRALQASPGTRVLIASVADKFGDNGTVCVSIVRKEARDTARLDTFLMSCRVMGRFIEDQILDQLVKELRSDGLAKLRVQYIPTKRNAPARAFIERLQGGRLISDKESGAETWEFDITKTSPVTKLGYAELLTQPDSLSETLS